jgi:hypothetical protein
VQGKLNGSTKLIVLDNVGRKKLRCREWLQPLLRSHFSFITYILSEENVTLKADVIAFPPTLCPFAE